MPRRPQRCCLAEKVISCSQSRTVQRKRELLNFTMGMSNVNKARAADPQHGMVGRVENKLLSFPVVEGLVIGNCVRPVRLVDPPAG